MNFVLSVLLDYAVPIAFLVAGVFNLLGKWGRYDSDDERTVWQKKFGVLFIVDAVLFPSPRCSPQKGRAATGCCPSALPSTPCSC